MSLGLIIIIGIASVGVYCLFTGKKDTGNINNIEGISAETAIEKNIKWIEEHTKEMKVGENRKVRPIFGELFFPDELIINYKYKNHNIYSEIKDHIENTKKYTVAITANRKFLIKKLS